MNLYSLSRESASVKACERESTLTTLTAYNAALYLDAASRKRYRSTGQMIICVGEGFTGEKGISCSRATSVLSLKANGDTDVCLPRFRAVGVTYLGQRPPQLWTLTFCRIRFGLPGCLGVDDALGEAVSARHSLLSLKDDTL